MKRLCPKCGVRERETIARSYCNSCLCQLAKEYRDKHPGKVAAYAREYRKNNKEKCDASNLAWRAKNEDKVRHYNKEYQRRRKLRDPDYQMYNAIKLKYGLEREEYDAMLAAEPVCPICLGEYDSPYVDHCHDTDEVRGLLCSTCNTGLGMFKDDVATLSRAIKYLK